MKCRTTQCKIFTDIIEVWKDIKGCESIYQISNFGNVKSLSRYKTNRWGTFTLLKEILLKQKTTSQGYKSVHLRAQTESWPSVHRLVAEHFIDNPENKPTVNHKDADKTNNHFSNLEWSTYSEQMQHAFENNLIELRGAPRFSPELKRKILQHYLDTSCSIRKLALDFNMNQRTASRIAKGEVERKTKLSDKDVIEIIKLRSEGKTLSFISKLFNCGTSQIHRITRKESRCIQYERN